MSDIRVFIADTDQQGRDDLVGDVEQARGLALAGAAATDDDGLLQILSTNPDAVVVRMPTSNEAIDLCRRMLDARRRIRCLVVATTSEEEAFVQAVLAGAAGIVRRERLVATLRDEDRELLERATHILETYGSRDPDDLFAELTPQQRDVALLVVSGATNSEIAARLNISPHTVRNYLSRILSRLRMRNRTELAAGLAAALVRAGMDTHRR
ncbi:MAG: response regulator transcription factor [Actinobacteria bacterium]|nr:response regulator transcription factor [Actinomycetota bacterium]